MPTQKSRLSRSELARHLTDARQLRTAGVDLESPEECDDNSRFLDVFVAGLGSMAFDLRTGGVGYVFLVRLIARRRCVVTTCRITTDDDKHIVLRSFDKESRLCKFDYLDFLQEEVLNCRIENSLRFHHPGDMVEGTILAMGIIPISQPYVHFKLTFEDSLDNEVSFRGLLSVDRAAKPRKRTVSKEADLYGPSTLQEQKSL
jgi:hypothetical protein